MIRIYSLNISNPLCDADSQKWIAVLTFYCPTGRITPCMSTERIKQALMAIGALTVVGVLAMVGMIAYVWWDTREPDVETDFDTDFETDFEADVETDTDESESEAAAE